VALSRRIALSVTLVAVLFASLAAAGGARRPQPVDVRWARAIVVRNADLPKEWSAFPPLTSAGYVEAMGGCKGVPNITPPSGFAYSSADGPDIPLESVDSFACIYPTTRQASAFVQGLVRAYVHSTGSVTRPTGKHPGSLSFRPYPIPGTGSYRNFREVIRTTKPGATGSAVFDIGVVRVGRAVLQLTMGGIPPTLEAHLIHSMVARMAYPPGRPA